MPVIITHTTVEPMLTSLQSSTEGLDFLHSDLTLFRRFLLWNADVDPAWKWGYYIKHLTYNFVYYGQNSIKIEPKIQLYILVDVLNTYLVTVSHRISQVTKGVSKWGWSTEVPLTFQRCLKCFAILHKQHRNFLAQTVSSWLNVLVMWF